MANIVSSVTSRTPQASNLSCFLNVSLILCRCKCSSTRKISTLKVVYQWVSCSNSRLMSTWYFLSSGQFSVLPAHGALQIRFQGIRPLTRTLIMHSVLDSTHLRTITRSLMETSSNIYIDYISSHITDLRFSTYPFSDKLRCSPYTNGSQYLDFTKTWIYVEDPILGSLCVPTSVLVTPNTITRYVL